MPEYAKMKNADLEALLKERGLPHGGKKADMVDRLQKDDEKKTAAPVEAKSTVNAEDEIDWDDDADEVAPSAPAKAAEATSTSAPAVATGEQEQPSNPQGVATQAVDATTEDSAAKDPTTGDKEIGDEAKVEEKKEPVPDYSIGLAATNLDEEIEKRRKRALKFGLDPEKDEGLKKLERAKKFGETGPPKGLDEALPERSRKRGREDGSEDAGGNKRRGGRQGGRGGQRGGNHDNRENRNRDGQDTRRESNKRGDGTSWMSENDRAAAEARKAKWAKPAA